MCYQIYKRNHTQSVNKNRVRKSRRTLQKYFRNSKPYLLTRLWYSKYASFNSLLLYRPDFCSEIHALSYCSNEQYRYKP